MRLFEIAIQSDSQYNAPSSVYVTAETEDGALRIAQEDTGVPQEHLSVRQQADAVDGLPPRVIARR